MRNWGSALEQLDFSFLEIVLYSAQEVDQIRERGLGATG